MATEYGNAPAFRSSLYRNLTMSTNSQVFGQLRQAGKFSSVRVYNAGHRFTNPRYRGRYGIGRFSENTLQLESRILRTQWGQPVTARMKVFRSMGWIQGRF